MKHMFIPLTLVVTAGLALAQEKPTHDHSKMDATTMAGCLTKGAQADQFYIVESKDKKSEISSTQDLNAHTNKQIKVTGTKDNVQGREVFKVTRVEVVSESCPSSGS